MKASGKTAALIAATALCLMLSGCGQAPAKDAAAAPTQPGSPPRIESSGEVAQKVKNLLAPYQQAVQRLSQAAQAGIDYTIPGSLMETMAAQAEEKNVRAENGRYRFTYEQSRTAVYRFSGLEVTQEMETPQPDNEVPMGEGSISDLAVTGGGDYRREYVYDVAEDMQDGRMEVTETLNGEVTGHEVFTFCKRADGFYFVDAAPEMSVNVDTLDMTGEWLVTIGRWREDRAETAEYRLPAGEAFPDAASLDFDALVKEKSLLAYADSQ